MTPADVVVGTEPWLPKTLRRYAWLSEPVPAVRLAALRIAVGALLTVDILATYWPHVTDLFGEGSLGAPEVFPRPRFAWSLFAGVTSPTAFRVILIAWALAAVLLTLGIASRASAAFAWVTSVSLLHLNPPAHSAADMVRILMLFILALSPCGAVWAIRGAQRSGPSRSVLIHPWPLRLLMLQMAVIYFGNGLHKLAFEHGRPGDWLRGDAVYVILANLNWARFSYPWQPMPYPVTRVLTWLIFAFEIGFPIWMLIRPARKPALIMGAAFHLGLFVFMLVGMFPLYMLCFYVPLLPWERLAISRASRRASASTPGAAP